MAHFAKINDSNLVTDVIVIHNNELLDENNVEQESLGISFAKTILGDGKYVQTSYNDAFRNQFAGIGFIWDSDNDVFYEPSPYPSWSLDSNYNWQSPVPRPQDSSYDYEWAWNEANQTWDSAQI